MPMICTMFGCEMAATYENSNQQHERVMVVLNQQHEERTHFA